MERFVVTHTKDGLWSVSHQEHTLSVYPTEEQALSATFKAGIAIQPAGAPSGGLDDPCRRGI